MEWPVAAVAGDIDEFEVIAGANEYALPRVVLAGAAIGRTVAIRLTGEERLHPLTLAADVRDFRQLNDPLPGQSFLSVTLAEVRRQVV
jgi:hypothetical protein